MGDLNTEDAQCRIISKRCGVILVSVDYRLAPAHRYPTALDDCVEAARWAMENRSKLGVRDGPVAMIGTSAGGGLAFSTALRLIDEGLSDQLAGVVGLVPVTVHPDRVPSEMKERYTSYDEHAEHTVNTKDAMETFFGRFQYLPKGIRSMMPLAH
jgi:versiconal hemiacetal acetate esterase